MQNELFQVSYQNKHRDQLLELVGDCLVADQYDDDEDRYGSVMVVRDNDEGTLRDILRDNPYDFFDGCGIGICSALGFGSQSNEVTFVFDTPEDASDFLVYMSDGGGEQGFMVGGEYEGKSYRFNYHDPGGDVVVVTTHEREEP